MASIDPIRAALASSRPVRASVVPELRAAVAVVLCERPGDVDLLFIERAHRVGDPWSGHMAFPGGRVEPDDESPRAAAEREAREEVGLCLADAELLGQLDDRHGKPSTHPEFVVSAFVYHLADPGELRLNFEVEDAFWFPLSGLRDPARRVRYITPAELEYPGILVGEPDRHVVWGLTYSFLESFFERLGSPLPDRWTHEMRRFARTR